jgi:cysteine desulfurase/selenocysteine lyase
MIYLDNAATSNPKLAACLEKGMREYLELGASPGRGGYDAAVLAQQRAWQVRGQVADFFGAPGYITCFGYNATDVLNTLIMGLVKPGGHVVSTRLEHNSVLRPLNHLSRNGVCSFDLAPFNGQGQVEPEAVAKALRPDTCLVVLNHASNVLGTIQPAAEIGRICQEQQIPLILDASQSAGLAPIKMAEWGFRP